MMVRHVPASKWYQEIAGWGLDATVTDALVDCLTQDYL
jgi:hypothetical protein